MKLHLKIISLVIICLLIITSLSFLTFADSSTVLPKSSTPPVIDGAGNDSCWSGVAAETLSEANITTSASIKMTWDSNYLYVLAVVSDQTPSDVIGNYPWKSDSFELYLDGTKSGSSFVQVRVNKNGALSGDMSGEWSDYLTDASMRAALPGIQDAVQVDANAKTYTVELAVPFAPSCVMGKAAQDTQAIGYAFQINDDTTGLGTQDRIIATFQGAADASNFSTAYLGSAPSSSISSSSSSSISSGSSSSISSGSSTTSSLSDSSSSDVSSDDTTGATSTVDSTSNIDTSDSSSTSNSPNTGDASIALTLLATVAISFLFVLLNNNKLRSH